MTEQDKIAVDVIIKDILGTISKKREQEIIARRWGLYKRRETLEQIGDLLGITRERVRQLEKVTITKLSQRAGELPHIEGVTALFEKLLDQTGGVSTIEKLSSKINDKNTTRDQSRIAFLAYLSENITFSKENDQLRPAAAISSKYSEKALKQAVSDTVKTIKKIGKPVSIQEITAAMGFSDAQETAAISGISKQIATLNNRWGLEKWPMVNPKNIRDKIYVILYEREKQMHFSEIAKAIQDSDIFRRKDVTTQAVHNELIKDKRFVLVGRGTYALKEWGFKKGTVSDVIADVLKKAGEPLHRDEIVKRVLKRRFVKETTVLLNLQGKKQFKRTAKATYTFDPEWDK